MRTILLGVPAIVFCLALAGCGNQNAGSNSGLWKQPSPSEDMTGDPYERYANEMRDRPLEKSAPAAAVAVPPPATTTATSSSPPATGAPQTAPAPRAP